MVTQFSPSPVLSCIESYPQKECTSHISLADSDKKLSSSSTSKVLQDVHIVRAEKLQILHFFQLYSRFHTVNSCFAGTFL